MTPDPNFTAFALGAGPGPYDLPESRIVSELTDGDWAADGIGFASVAAPAPANVPVAPGHGFAIDGAGVPLEQGDSAFGTVAWRTLICSDRTPSSGMVLGVAEFGPGGTLEAHRHGPAEIYFGLTGAGLVTIERVDHAIGPGVAVFIPAEAEHRTVAGPDGLTFAYTFPTSRFGDIDYRFTGRGIDRD